MIKYICPGYLALATWTGEVYSPIVTVDLWCEWRLDAGGQIHTLLHPTKDTGVGETWSASLIVDRTGPMDRLLYITLFAEVGTPMHRYEGTGQVFVPLKGTRVEMIMGGGS